MRAPRSILVCSVLVTVGCDRRASESAAEGSPGRVEIASERGPLLSAPGEAAWCERDSSVALVATGGDWVVALSVRTGRWPLDSAMRFPVRSTAGAPGGVALAVRSLRDSVHSAFLGRAGDVGLRSGDDLDGDLDVQVATEAGDTLHVRGTMQRVAVRTDACPVARDSAVARGP